MKMLLIGFSNTASGRRGITQTITFIADNHEVRATRVRSGKTWFFIDGEEYESLDYPEQLAELFSADPEQALEELNHFANVSFEVLTAKTLEVINANTSDILLATKKAVSEIA